LGRALALALVASCDGTPPRHLPGASLTPRLAIRAAPRACGEDITLGGNTIPFVRYAYSYDARDRLVQATGEYAAGGPADSVAYTYDHLGHVTHMVESRGPGGVRVELVATYDSLGDLITYDNATGVDVQHYVFSELTDTGQPAREVTSATGQAALGYSLEYDALARVSRVVADTGSTTTYTYDDDARTLVVDTDNGAYRGLLTYDDHAHELSEAWDGTAPGVVATQTDYDWSADRLLAVTYLSGSAAMPHSVATTEIDTLRYDCR
jgi:YD repeat-containing protein